MRIPTLVTVPSSGSVGGSRYEAQTVAGWRRLLVLVQMGAALDLRPNEPSFGAMLQWIWALPVPAG